MQGPLAQSVARANVSSRSFVPQPVGLLEELIDLEFEAFCAREGDEDVTLDEVRKATESIPGSMAEAIIEDERADRF